VADALEKAGFRTDIVGSGEQALVRLAHGGIDLIIVAEIMQPDDYGDAFLKILRKAHPTVPIFTLDEPLLGPKYDGRFPGHKEFPEDPRDEGRSLYYFLHREGYMGDLYLTPPVNPKELVTFVRRALEDSGSDG
jgi:DNA-binding response OmpR family regulator